MIDQDSNTEKEIKFKLPSKKKEIINMQEKDKKEAMKSIKQKGIKSYELKELSEVSNYPLINHVSIFK